MLNFKSGFPLYDKPCCFFASHSPLLLFLFVRISGLCDFICVDELRGVGICSIFAPLRKGGKPGFRRLTWGFLRFSEFVLMFFKIYFANTKKLSTFAFPNEGSE